MTHYHKCITDICYHFYANSVLIQAHPSHPQFQSGLINLTPINSQYLVRNQTEDRESSKTKSAERTTLVFSHFCHVLRAQTRTVREQRLSKELMSPHKQYKPVAQSHYHQLLVRTVHLPGITALIKLCEYFSRRSAPCLRLWSNLEVLHSVWGNFHAVHHG